MKSILIIFFLTLFFTGCCSVGGGDVDTSRIISQKTPRQAFSRLKCALLYGSNGAEVAYDCFSESTKKEIPFWKFKYGFNLLDYDKNKKLKLWEILTNLMVQDESYEDTLIFSSGKVLSGRIIEEEDEDKEAGDKGFVKFLIEDEKIITVPLDKIKKIISKRYLICTTRKEFNQQYDYNYQETLILIRNKKKNWKVDLIETYKIRGILEDLDKTEKPVEEK